MDLASYSPYLALIIFSASFLAIIFGVFDRSAVAMCGAILMILFRILPINEAIAAVDFETLGLLMGMMILVDVANSSEIFSWFNLRIVKWTRGKPWLIFVLFSLVTFVFSAFLDNITVMIETQVEVESTLGKKIHTEIYDLLGFHVDKLDFLPGGTIPRTPGKAVRVVDKRE